MKIQELTLDHFRGIQHSSFQLAGKSTVFFGVNGVGKSTTLRAICILYANLLNRLTKNRFQQEIHLEWEDIAAGSLFCELSTTLVIGDIAFPYSCAMDRQTRQCAQSKSIDQLIARFTELYLNTAHPSPVMPIFVHYGVNRLVSEIPLRIRHGQTYDQLSAFTHAIDSRAEFRTFFEWFRSQEEWENNIRANEDPSYRDTALQAVRHAVEEMLAGVTNLRVERKPLAFKVDKHGIALRVEQLSDGEKCTLALVGDLARRLALANPGLDNPLLGEGVVLIDEIELHLHPKWQRRILRTLSALFPHIQFIVSTHSPQVLGEITEAYNIYCVYELEGRMHYDEIRSLNGWDANYILEEFMGTSRLNVETKKLIDRMYALIDAGRYDEAEPLVQQLASLTDEAHEDVVRANILIARGRHSL